MESVTPVDVWAAVAAILGGIVLIGNAAGKIADIVRAFRSPNNKQNSRLDSLEKRMTDAERKLNSDYDHLQNLDEGNRVTQRALLALLGHGIDGNNLNEMEAAKTELQNHLINR